MIQSLRFEPFCFFFQAEDGIRDLVRSRGLGHHGLEEYLETKHILMNTNPEPVNWFGKQ